MTTQLPILPPKMLRDALRKRRSLYRGWRDVPMTKPQHNEVLRIGHALFPNDRGPVQHLKLLTLVRFLFGRSSTKNFDKAEAHVFISWARIDNWGKKEGEIGPPPPDPQSVKEAAAMIALNDEEQGQLSLPLGKEACL